jgi:hypothetical protein
MVSQIGDFKIVEISIWTHASAVEGWYCSILKDFLKGNNFENIIAMVTEDNGNIVGEAPKFQKLFPAL